MNPLYLLALIQGLTEFFPVSSSGHLVLAKIWLGFRENGIEMETWVHMGTLLSLVAYFWRDLARLTAAAVGRGTPEDRRWIPLILVSTAITGAVGVFGRKFFVETFSDLNLTYAGFIVTGIVLLATRWARTGRAELRMSDGVWFGIVQAISIIPSISRSGATIACLLFLGVERGTAFRYSFIASLPAIAGAFLLELREGNFSTLSPQNLGVSFVIAAAAGIASLYALKRFVDQNKFHWFGYYCLVIGLVGFAVGRR